MMETWVLMLSISISISISAILLRSFLHLIISPSKKLPPGPSTFFFPKSFSQLEPILRPLHAKFGPIVTLRIGPRPAIFIADRSLAHQALVQKGAVFASRPPPATTVRVISTDQHTINSSSYGPTWRLLRRNLTSEILNPSRVRSYGHARTWVLHFLITRFELLSESGKPVRVIDHLQLAMFWVLVIMCLGEKLDEEKVKEIEQVERRLIVNLNWFGVLNLWPSLSKILFRKRWSLLLKYRKDQEDVLLPIIRARRQKMEEERFAEKNGYVLSYLDTLFDLELPETKRKLSEVEIVSLCNEFINAGTDTTLTALQWIMANLVKYPHIQEKLYLEIEEVMGVGEDQEVKEEYLQNLPYLKAVILEGLRRHPPGHFVAPHAVTQDVVLDKYVIPKNATINFMVAEMGWDPKVWEDPMSFKPERFMNNGGEAFDITGSREIKMMPFGAGRRICPAYGLAMLHLEYFVANLIWKFKWKAVDGDDNIDMSEKQEVTMVMKCPLHVHISQRV